MYVPFFVYVAHACVGVRVCGSVCFSVYVGGDVGGRDGVRGGEGGWSEVL